MTEEYKPSAGAGAHPITPPPELIAKWAGSMCGYYEAARWGADQELEACCEWLKDTPWDELREAADDLRADRRPSKQPPTADELIKLAEAMRGIAGHEGRWLDELERVAQLLEQQSRALEQPS